MNGASSSATDHIVAITLGYPARSMPDARYTASSGTVVIKHGCFGCLVIHQLVSQRSKARTGPINVKDTEFNSSHILKYQSLVNKGAQMFCSVCSLDINVKHMDHLRVALCPQDSCTAVSHLDCLAKAFFNDPLNPQGLIPRGGVCEACDQYTLWGDVIRGCYRRARGGLQNPTSEQESEEDDNEDSIRLGNDPSSRFENPQITGSPRKATKAPTVRVTTSRQDKPMPAPRVTKRSAQKAKRVDSDAEDFGAEMDAIECDTEDSEPARPSRKDRGTTASRKHAPRSMETRAGHDKPRDVDEIVRQALGNLSISTPSKPYQARPVKSSRAKVTKAKNQVEVIREERASESASARGEKRTTLAIASKPRKRRTPSPEYIDLDGV
ncbi:hypothetical protein RSAG8_08574, partial [Rhizoctonia solani AG-8 WAC10335]